MVREYKISTKLCKNAFLEIRSPTPKRKTILEKEGKQADLLVANNVLAHVPDLNGFVASIRRVLKPTGVAVLEIACEDGTTRFVAFAREFVPVVDLDAGHLVVDPAALDEGEGP